MLIGVLVVYKMGLNTKLQGVPPRITIILTTSEIIAHQGNSRLEGQQLLATVHTHGPDLNF